MLKYLKEVKQRISFLFLLWVVTSVICYVYKETLLFLIAQPNMLYNQNFNTFYFFCTDVKEVFSAYLKITNFITLHSIFLFLIYHCYVFLSLALSQIERKLIRRILKIMTFTFFFSAVLSHRILIPKSWNFFFSFQSVANNSGVNFYFESKLSEYLNFYFFYYLSFVIICQIIAFIFIVLSYITFDINKVKKFRKKYYYFFIFFPALLSSSDLLNQMALSFLFIILYEIFMFYFIFKKLLKTRL
jgi:Sec-independent protein secretion pathway component TatC